ncbi:hypothetical protein GYMLUDRAFT_73243 [Collybiopsis luxurians FD-317 M1]|uniref:Uncharacterized protein n=1 Tax=Collybiopsis luxurians FD-317 M1 TaxID=944289 RepID=A0A0D0C0L3_9AGAR|nr:hypothetical protein GYMLUDRAFT_73243 [Collybiopsis luxurians FD-317 M1]
MALGISEAQLLGVFLASVFWGMFLITFVQCMRYLLWDSKGVLRSASSINWIVFIVAILLAILSTLDIALGLMHAIEAFIFYTGPGGSNARFTGLTDWVNILKTCNIVFGKLISDGVLIYRCWVVYNKSWFIISFPLLLWLGYLGLAIFVVYLEASAGNPHVLLTGPGSLSSLTPSITAGWTMSLVNNILATGLIVYRIWQVDKNSSMYAAQSVPSSHGFFSRSGKRTRLQNVIRIIIESGGLYTVMALITFITFETGSASFYPTSDAELQILSIAFNLIVIRISSRPEEKYDIVSRKHPTFPLQNFTSVMQTSVGGDITSKRTLEVMVTNEEDVNVDYSPSRPRSRESRKSEAEIIQGRAEIELDLHHHGSAV